MKAFNALWIYVCVVVLMFEAKYTSAQTCMTVKVENALYQPQLNTRFHQSNYICSKQAKRNIYHTISPPQPRPFVEDIRAKRTVVPDYPDSDNNIRDNIIVELLLGDVNNNTNAMDITTPWPNEQNYFLYFIEDTWRIGLSYCATTNSIALVRDGGSNPMQITEVWMEYDETGGKWTESPFMKVICGTKVTNEQMYLISIGIVAFACVIFIMVVVCRKRRPWQTLEEEEDCEVNEDPTFIRPEDLAHIFPGNTEPPSYEDVTSSGAVDAPPPLYEDVAETSDGDGSVAVSGSSPPPVYEASTEEPPAYTERSSVPTSVPTVSAQVQHSSVPSAIPIIGATTMIPEASVPLARTRRAPLPPSDDDYIEDRNYRLTNDAMMTGGALWLA